MNNPPYLQCEGYLHMAVHDALGITEADLAATPNFPPAFIVEEGKIVQFNFSSPFTGDEGTDARFWAYLGEIGAGYLNDDGIPEFSAEIVPRLIEDAARYAGQSGG